MASIAKQKRNLLNVVFADRKQARIKISTTV